MCVTVTCHYVQSHSNPYPSSVNALQAVQQLLIIVVPGSTLSLIISINVSVVWLRTMTKNDFPISYSTLPNTNSPFT